MVYTVRRNGVVGRLLRVMITVLPDPSGPASYRPLNVCAPLSMNALPPFCTAVIACDRLLPRRMVACTPLNGAASTLSSLALGEVGQGQGTKLPLL